MNRAPWGACALSIAVVLGGCASDESAGMQSGSSPSTTDDTDAGQDGSGSSGDNNGSASSSSGSGGGDGDAGGGNTPIDPARPAEPCGEDLEADNGEVRPDLGSVPVGDAFEGDPLEAGAFQVVSADFEVDNPDSSLNPIPLTIYGPSEDGASVADGKHPLVMVMPGYGKGFGIQLSGLYPTYEFYIKHLVSHGFVVVGMNFIAGGIGVPLVTTESLGAHFLTAQEKNVDEVRAVMDFVLGESPTKAQIDDSKIAIAGHSQGGKVAFMTAAADPRIDLVIGWDPQNAGGGTPCAGAPDTCNRLPVAPICPDPEDPTTGDPGKLFEMRAESLVFAARDSGAMPDTHQWAENFYRGAASPAHMLLFPSASHENWSDGDNPVAQTTMRAQAALLMTRFLGATGLTPYLPGGDKLVEGISDVEQHNK